MPRELLFNGDVKARRDSDQFVFAPRFGGEMFLVSAVGSVRRITGPEPFSAVEEYLRINGSSSGDSYRWGYYGLDVTDHAIYGLFSGAVTHGHDPDDVSPFGRELHILPWGSDTWERLRLDAPGKAIAVQEPYVYIAAAGPVPEIRAYRLESVDDGAGNAVGSEADPRE